MFLRRGILYVAGAVVLIAPSAAWLVSSLVTNPPRRVLAPVEVRATEVERAAAPLAELAARDPLAVVRRGIERYDREIREYRCVLLKQERLEGGLTPVQEVEVRFRQSPQTVYMLWRTNADQAKRALFVDDGRNVDQDGQKLARVEPAGALVHLFVKDIYMPIDGPEARQASRRSIAECGFRATFTLLERYNALAAERGVLDLKYGGTGVVDGRPTYVIVRNLPHGGDGDVYPDARMVLHLDQEWLLPVAVYSYADHEEQELLGSYVFMKVELNPKFEADAFRF